MSTATVQQIGQDLAGWIAAVQRGEIVAIVDAGTEVARLMPPQRKQGVESPPAWPDFLARQRAIFGDKVLPAGTVDSLIDEDRGEW